MKVDYKAPGSRLALRLGGQVSLWGHSRGLVRAPLEDHFLCSECVVDLCRGKLRPQQTGRL